MTYIVELLEIVPRTHNVRTYRVTRPAGFNFLPGQATDFSIVKSGWENEKRPFTFTGLPEDGHLEFTIKSYDDHDGVTHQLRAAQKGDKFEISDAWGAISYQGEGVFIAGGAGVTPFIAILRSLKQQNEIQNNKLLFSNRTEKDIILKEEFESMLGENFINFITQQPDTKYINAKIDRKYLQENIVNFDQHFYVCGPDPFNTAIIGELEGLGAKAETLIFEK
ncbi:MAG TPA: hypothetical protein VKR32_04085 [Puia sp.]|nr:hypothetical protein [Puia sp.]